MTSRVLTRHEGFPEQPHDFAELLSPAQWYRLPAPVRRRFSAEFGSGRTVCYRGRVVDTRLSRVGWLLANLTRCIGAPLPLREGPGMATVVVSDHPGNAGQVWSRLYHRGDRVAGFPQSIHSVKKFTGPTGLEEYLGWGLSIALELRADGRALAFIGRRYFVKVAGWRVELPRWLCPGVLTVVHTEEQGGWFTFSMSLDHPRLGQLIYQLARFRDDPAASTHA